MFILRTNTTKPDYIKTLTSRKYTLTNTRSKARRFKTENEAEKGLDKLEGINPLGAMCRSNKTVIYNKDVKAFTVSSKNSIENLYTRCYT